MPRICFVTLLSMPWILIANKSSESCLASKWKKIRLICHLSFMLTQSIDSKCYNPNGLKFIKILTQLRFCLWILRSFLAVFAYILILLTFSFFSFFFLPFLLFLLFRFFKTFLRFSRVNQLFSFSFSGCFMFFSSFFHW